MMMNEHQTQEVIKMNCKIKITNLKDILMPKPCNKLMYNFEFG